MDLSHIHDLHGITEALSSIGIDASALTPDQIDHVIQQIDAMLAQHAAGHGVQFGSLADRYGDTYPSVSSYIAGRPQW